MNKTCFELRAVAAGLARTALDTTDQKTTSTLIDHARRIMTLVRAMEAQRGLVPPPLPTLASLRAEREAWRADRANASQ